MEKALLWLGEHPELYIPLVLALVNLLWQSKTRLGFALRTLGPDPIAFRNAMKDPKREARWDEAKHPEKKEGE